MSARLATLGLGLLLCAAPAWAAPSLEDYLSERAHPHLRAVPARPGDLSFAPGGPPLERVDPGEPLPWFDVIEAGRQGPRVLIGANGVRLALYVDTASLALVTTARTVIAAGAGGVGVFLRPGRPLRVPAAGRAAYSNEEVSAEGAIDPRTVGTVYDSRRARGTWTQKPDAQVPAETVFLDAPAGRPLARLGRGGGLVKRLGRPRDGHALVSFVGRDGTVRVVGWLPLGQLEKVPGEEVGELYGEGGIGLVGAGPDARGLDIGTRLYDAPGGRLVGMTYWFIIAEPKERRGGWASWALTVDGLKVVVWSPPPRGS